MCKIVPLKISCSNYSCNKQYINYPQLSNKKSLENKQPFRKPCFFVSICQLSLLFAFPSKGLPCVWKHNWKLFEKSSEESPSQPIFSRKIVNHSNITQQNLPPKTRRVEFVFKVLCPPWNFSIFHTWKMDGVGIWNGHPVSFWD